MLVLALSAFFLVLAFWADCFWGSVALPPGDVWRTLWGMDVPEKVRILVWESRLPRALTAVAAGAGLAVSGLLMQTFFRNPVAGPYILGISSGAGLGVALVVLAGVGSAWSVAGAAVSIRVLAAALGAGGAMVFMGVLAGRVRDSATLLIFGLMLGSFTAALIGILQYFANRDALRDFIYWTFGSLDHTHWQELGWLMPITAVGLLWAAWLGPALDVLVLGESYARSMGVRASRLRLVLMGITAVLAGSITAFCGPIAFVGIAVPHAARALLGHGGHRLLVPVSALVGAGLMVSCDLVSRLPGLSATLPINAVTSLLGAPAVVVIVWRNRRIGAFFGAGS